MRIVLFDFLINTVLCHSIDISSAFCVRLSIAMNDHGNSDFVVVKAECFYAIAHLLLLYRQVDPEGSNASIFFLLDAGMSRSENSRKSGASQRDSLFLQVCQLCLLCASPERIGKGHPLGKIAHVEESIKEIELTFGLFLLRRYLHLLNHFYYVLFEYVNVIVSFGFPFILVLNNRNQTIYELHKSCLLVVRRERQSSRIVI